MVDRPTRRKLKREIEEIRDGSDPEALESWRRFITGDLDKHDERHYQWLTAGADRDVPDAEVREFIEAVNAGEIDPYEDVDE